MARFSHNIGFWSIPHTMYEWLQKTWTASEIVDIRFDEELSLRLLKDYVLYNTNVCSMDEIWTYYTVKMNHGFCNFLIKQFKVILKK